MSARSFAEYEAMFGLTGADLRGPILDCGAGASGFVAEVGARGGSAVAADAVYGLPRAELADAVRGGMAAGAAMLDRHADRFVWDWYGTPGRREALRAAAAAAFLADIGRRPSAYVAASLPRLPLRDAAVDLVLCSHLLFTWADRLDADWHLAALREMVRVARREVRVFPLVIQGGGASVPFLDDLCARLRADGLCVDMRQVRYEFQRGANQMLVAGHAPP